MDRQKFIKFVEQNDFNETTKKLLLISYDMGFNEGQIKQMERSIEKLDSMILEKEFK